MADETLKRTPLYDLHVSLGAKMVPFAGYEMPVRYTSELEEHRAVRQALGLFDLSHMGEVALRGADALAFARRALVSDPGTLDPGQAQYSMLCAPDGGVIDDVIVYRRDDGYLVVCNAANRDAVVAHLSALAAEWLGIHAIFGMFLAGVSVPRAGDVLEGLDRPLGRASGYLQPAFFILVGLKTSIGLLTTASDWLVGAAILAGAAGYVLKLAGAVVEAHAYGHGHTGDDTMVYFPDAKVVMVSDQITNATPIVDFANGGSAVEWTTILDGVLKLDFEMAIPGRGDPKTRAEVQAFRTNFAALVTRASDAITAGAGRDQRSAFGTGASSDPLSLLLIFDQCAAPLQRLNLARLFVESVAHRGDQRVDDLIGPLLRGLQLFDLGVALADLAAQLGVTLIDRVDDRVDQSLVRGR